MAAAPVQQSLLGWLIASLGFPYLVLLPLAGLLCLALALIVALRGKGPMAGASLVLIVPIPFLIGVFSAIEAGVSYHTVIAMGGATPTPADTADAISTALAGPLVGMLLMAPAYATAVLASFARSLLAKAEQNAPPK